MPIWVYVCIVIFAVVGVAAAAFFYGEKVWDLTGIGKPLTPAPAQVASIVPEVPTEPELKPITLDDVHVTSIRVGDSITIVLAWESGLPDVFHLWVSVDGGNLILNSPNNASRTIEILPSQELELYGSTLYHESNNNRLSIDLQVKGENKNE